jgi:2-methylcitrate dehydratase PrpD
MGDPTVAQRLSSMAVLAVPAPSLHEAARAVCAVVERARAGGSRDEARLLTESLRALGGDAEATVFGTGDRLPAPWAALANAAAAARTTDGEPATLPWPSAAAPVVAAAVAVAETAGASGAELLAAVAAGAEVTLRVSAGAGQSMDARGWDLTACLGGIGAAVAAGRLLRLDESALTAAIGIASTRAAGFGAARGTDVAAFQVGKAAADGIEAARMARRGFTAPATAIEGRRGLGHLQARDPVYPAIVAGLGELWLTAPSAASPPGRNAGQPDGASGTLWRACLDLAAAPGLSALLAETGPPSAGQHPVPVSQ